MKLVSVLTASTLLLAACSSDDPPATGAGTTSSSSGDQGGVTGEGVGSAASAPDKNAKGDAYPTGDVGVLPGKIIQNFKFVGYKDAAVTGGLKPISLAEFYDPTGETVRMIHIQAAGSWCSACRGETKALVPIKKDLDDRKVIWLVALAEGATGGSASTQKDLDLWIKDFDSPFTHLLDPNRKNLGVFFGAAALPWNADIDAKTMKIISSDTGGPTTGAAILELLDASLAKIK